MLLANLLLSTPATYVYSNPLPVIQIEETKQSIAKRIAIEENFDPQVLFNTIDTETGRTWDCSLVGKDGELGCLQIIPKYHPNVDPLNFEESVRYFISEYKAGREWQWTGCSCMQSARLTVPSLPRGDASDLIPNATLTDGEVAIFDYDGVIHAVAYETTPEGILAIKEGNFEPCLIKDRLIPWDEVNDHLVGFWD